MKTYYAHKKENQYQTVDDHLKNVSLLAEGFADSFEAGEYGRLVGAAHDIGKYSDGFQNRLNGGPKVDHSSAGAFECAMIDQTFAGICVAGHHSGLPDYGSLSDPAGEDTYIGRIKKLLSTDKVYTGWNGSLPTTSTQPGFGENGFALSLWIRMLYSCLVDADFLDTEAFMNSGETHRGGYDDITTLWNSLESFTSGWENPINNLNRIRNRIRQDCIRAGSEDKGLFTLTVPTGGGKTVSSLSFALKHAKKHGMKRIIYVIPYTSIIEQNAEVFRRILGENNVIEHHSEADLSYSEDLAEDRKRAALAAENWDAPVIVTTAVQFFDSLFANKPSRCRKLHNIANSVIIFDEAQSIPVGHLLPCMAVIGTLVKHFGVSAVLCSATQPFVSDLIEKYTPGMPIKEICYDVDYLYETLKRVNYEITGKRTLEELAKEIDEKKQVLCIVNTRKSAKDIYDLLPGNGNYHLSTLMIPQHRKLALDEIRKRLQNGLTCRVISTSLIEAGVDVDFPYVYREMTGLDSIVQAGGRCNREGKRNPEESTVTVFSLDQTTPNMLRINTGASIEALGYCSDPGKRKTVDSYFRSFRSLIGDANLDYSHAVKYLSYGKSGCLLPFRTVAEEFHLIDQNTKTVYIPTRESADLIELIKNGTADRNVYRKAGRYSVNIYENHYKALYNAGDIEELSPGVAVLINNDQYSPETGLSLAADNGRAEFI